MSGTGNKPIAQSTRRLGGASAIALTLVRSSLQIQGIAGEFIFVAYLNNVLRAAAALTGGAEGTVLIVFHSQSVQQNLSRWLRPAITAHEAFEETYLDLRNFFTSNITAHVPQVKEKDASCKAPSPKGSILRFVSRLEKPVTPSSPRVQEAIPSHEPKDALHQLLDHLQENMGYPSLSELPTPSFIKSLMPSSDDAEFWCLYALEPDALMAAVRAVQPLAQNQEYEQQQQCDLAFQDHWSPVDEILFRVFQSADAGSDARDAMVYCYATTAGSDSYRELLWIPLNMVGPPREALQFATASPIEERRSEVATPEHQNRRQPAKRKTHAMQSHDDLETENVSPDNRAIRSKQQMESVEEGDRLVDVFDEDDDFDLLQLSKTKNCLSAEQRRKRKGRR